MDMAHKWITDFWSTTLAPQPGGPWLIPVLRDFDLFIRDARAYDLLKDRLRGGPDAAFWFAPAWRVSAHEPPVPPCNVIFLGRPKALASSRLGPPATWLETNACGRFIDKRDGRPGDSVQYSPRPGETHVFTCHELERHDQVRRCDRDYGVLLLRRGRVLGQECCLRAIAGLTTLATLCLTAVLCDDEKRAELARQVEGLLRWRPEMRPEDSAEVCVEVAVDGAEALEDFLNQPVFTFAAVAVAVAGGELAVRAAPLREGILVPDGKGGGTLRMNGLPDIEISPARFELLKRLIEQPRECTVADLCRDLKLDENALGKRVHDLNVILQPLLSGLKERLVVQRDRKAHLYRPAKSVRISLK